METNPELVRAKAYDIVINGDEMGGEASVSVISAASRTQGPRFCQEEAQDSLVSSWRPSSMVHLPMEVLPMALIG